MRDLSPAAQPNFFCILPWLHLYVEPSGVAHACCFGALNQPIGNARSETEAQIWNGEKFRSFRRRMMDGELNKHCTRCRDAEVAGFLSLRQTANRKFAHHATRVARTNADGSLAEMRLAYLDFRFSNLCNFRCRTCGPWCSSAWHDDAVQLDEGYVAPTHLRWGTWHDVAHHLSTVEEINFAGGEPMLSDDHLQILQHLIALGRRDVKLSYNTNLSTLHHRGQFIPELWDHFDDVWLSVSLDALGRRGELLRKGKNWSNFERNVQALWRRDGRPTLGFTLTVSVFNVQHLPEVHAYLQHHGYLEGAGLDLNFLDKPSCYSVQILPPDLKQSVARRLESYVEQDHWQARDSSRTRFVALVQHLLAEDCSAEIPNFLAITRRLDALRGEDTFSVFPELAGLLPYEHPQPAGSSGTPSPGRCGASSS